MRKAPRQARAQVTVAAIVEAAAQLLARDGLAGFTSNKVAERAGVSIGTFYQYFPDKDALMAALISREQQARANGLGALAARLVGQPLDNVVAAIVAASVAADAASPRLALALDHEEARLPVADRVETAGAALDTALAALLAPHLPAQTPAERQAACRTARVIVRAIVDDAMAPPHPDPERARRDATQAALAWLQYQQQPPFAGAGAIAANVSSAGLLP
jgi:AcrR family transcriptional regulator